MLLLDLPLLSAFLRRIKLLCMAATDFLFTALSRAASATAVLCLFKKELAHPLGTESYWR